MRIRLILACSLALICAPLAAQQAPLADGQQEAVVTFTVAGRVAGSQEGLPQMSSSLLQRASADPRLASLTVEQDETRADARLRMVFVFRSEAEFRAWHASDPARELLDLVRRSTGTPSFSLDFKRFPLAHMIRVADSN